MKTMNVLLYVIIFGVLSSCSTVYYSYWNCTTYDPSNHTFKIDSAYLAKYGKKATDQLIRIKAADHWIVDSMVYFSLYLEKEQSTMPIIPIFYRIEYQKKSSFYKLKIYIGNNKIYKSLDSVSYTIYDSLGTVCYTSRYNYNRIITESRKHELFETPYTINIKLKETDIIYGDMDLFFTDYNNKPVMQTIRRIKFKYDKGRYFTSDINS